MKEFKAHFTFRTYVGTHGIFKRIACSDIDEAEKLAKTMANKYGWTLKGVAERAQ